MNTLKPLEGVKIIDFTIYVAAPAVTSIFGYLGAEVIKIETPKGDPYRLSGAGFGLPIETDFNPLYDTVNGYKKGLSLDMRSEEGKAVMRRLIKQADIFVTNYRDNALAGMGFTYEDVKQINPSIVYAIAGGYGDQGPDAARAGFDSTAFFARSGWALEASHVGESPASTPSGSGDTVTSMGLGVGILAAYIQAKSTGVGCKVSSSLYTSALWAVASPAIRRQFAPRPTKAEESPKALALCFDYQCKDGVWVRFCGMSAERYWANFCEALGFTQYREDERFTTSAAMLEHVKECAELIRTAMITKSYAEWEPLFVKYDLPFEHIMEVTEALQDTQAIANGYVTEVSYDNGQTFKYPNPPIKVSTLEPEKRTRAPFVGEHSTEILKEFGFAEDEINALIAGGAVKQYK